MIKKITTISIALFWCCLSVLAADNSRPFYSSLRELNDELQTAYLLLPEDQAYLDAQYEQHSREMLDAITKANEQAILLYTQEQYMTFDMSYVLKKVTTDYKDFAKKQSPYEWILNTLDFEIDRYTRLVEALRRLPVEQDSIDVPFDLDKESEFYRDSCLFYASQILQTYSVNRDLIQRDSIHYQETCLRMKENYDYAERRYQELQQYVFVDGQVPLPIIVKNFSQLWEKIKLDVSSQYDTSAFEDSDDTKPAKPEDMSIKGVRVVLIIGCIAQLIAVALFWLIVYGLIWLIARYVNIRRFVSGKQWPLLSVLVGTLLYILIFRYFWGHHEYLQMGVRNINTFLWLLIAIAGSLLLRVKPEKIRHGIWLYSPALVVAFLIIFCRNTFIPDSLMVLIFPPVMLMVIVRQLVSCIRRTGRASSIDTRLGWTSLVVYVFAFVFASMGYTFVCLLILVWWYFQLAMLLAFASMWSLLDRFKTNWLDKRVDAMRERITYVSGEDRESLLFGATWFYDLIRQVCMPALLILSLPMCALLSLNIFDFNDLFHYYYTNPFVCITGDDGVEMMRISAKSTVFILILFFVLRYLNRAVHAVWQYARYAYFMRKNQRKTIRPNEINLSLGNSIISVVVWMIFAVIVVIEWKIPTGSLGLVAGGLSAGIGLALKDIINNFIYGIQLMGGRLRVGDWIECDGVRGKVTSINYQCVQVETVDYTEMSFLNASLFGSNFNNLTRNHSYEMTKLKVGVAYGTDVEKAREVLVKAMQQMRTKDRYGREIVDPKRGIYVIVDEMADSAVVLGVKQMVLVAEQIPYVEHAKEVIYNALNEAGITIAFPQIDVHMIKEEK